MSRFLKLFGLRPREDDVERQKQITASAKPLSHFSSGSVQDSRWSSLDFLLGVGMIIIQQNTHKIVMVHNPVDGCWFFPRGRKDTGETLEQAALREAYEESGYRVQLLPLRHTTRQPVPGPPESQVTRRLNTESIYLTFKWWKPAREINPGQVEVPGHEYLTFWWAGQIPQDAIRELGTGMPNEQSFESHLLNIDEAMERVFENERPILKYVWECYQETLNWKGENQGL